MEAVRITFDLAINAEQRHAIESERNGEYRISNRKMARLFVRICQRTDTLPKGQQCAGDENSKRCEKRPEIRFATVTQRGLPVRRFFAAPLSNEKKRFVSSIRDSVKRLGQHRAGCGKGSGSQLGGSDAKIRCHCHHHRPAAVCFPGDKLSPSGAGCGGNDHSAQASFSTTSV